MIGYLYKITSPSKKVYIGITHNNPKKRWNEHKDLCHRDKKRKLYKAMRHYGIEHMNFEVLTKFDNINWEELERIEMETIKKYNSFFNGYNSTLGGEGTLGLSGNLNPFYHRKHTEKTLAILSAKAKERHHSLETRMKISQAGMGRKNSQKSILKMKKIAAETKGKKVICDDDGNIFKTITDCSNFYDINRSDIRKVCNRTRTFAKGKRFSWLGDKTPYYIDTRQKPIFCVQTEEYFNSTKEACEKLGLVSQHVSAVLRGKQKTTKGYSFIYAGQYRAKS